jgi:nucleotide-binding universal stress UspA family protein
VAWEEINAVAEEIDADLVVIGTHGRRGLARALLGSVAEHVVRTGRRPIVTIRSDH